MKHCIAYENVEIDRIDISEEIDAEKQMNQENVSFFIIGNS